MSRFLKTIVNIILLCAIVVAGGLLIPPFVGVTTVIVDDVDMDTNLAKGSVTYALDRDSSELNIGSKVLIYEGDSQNVYEITKVDGESYTLEDKLSIDGGTKEITLGSSAKKVLFTVPFVGYVTMALRTTEGLIIVGLAVVFVIILFILSEIWKKDEEDDEEDDEEEGESDDEPEELSRREKKKALKAQKKAEKAAAKKAAKEEKKAAKAEKKADKKSVDDEEQSDEVLPEGLQDLPMKEAAATLTGESETTEEDQKLFDETSTFFAADIASMLGIDQEESDKEDTATEERVVTEVVVPEKTEETVPKEEEAQVRRLAMPAYTREELIEKAKAAGEEPDIVEDETNGITFLDYSDIL
ncbi:MAG: hypothetical protein ACI4TF_13780 [Oliverpabstia sp.]